MSDINWAGLVQRTNPFGEFADGMARGQEMRQSRVRENLFMQKQAAEAKQLAKAEALDDENRLERGILGNMARTDPRAAAAKAVEVGQFDMAGELSKLDENQRKVARENAEDLGGFASGLLGLPLEQRKGVIEQAAPILTQKGFKPEQIQAFDPSDANLQALVSSSMTLKTALEEANRKRDDARATERDAEMSQYREDMLDIAGRRVGVTERREGRAASGGGRGGRAAPKLPTGFILD